MVVLVAVISVLVIGAQASLLSVHPPARVLLARQIDGNVPSECYTACVPIQSAANSCAGEGTCSCTQIYGEAFQACLDCVAAVDPSFDAQADLNAYVQACSYVGMSFNPPLTIIPSAPSTVSAAAPATISANAPTSTGASTRLASKTFAPSPSITQTGTPHAKPHVLSSTDASACGASGLSISNLGMNYYPVNHTLEFAVVGQAQQSGLSPNISIVVSAYGYTAPAQIVNLCAITSCPLSGSFSGKVHIALADGLISSILGQVRGSQTLDQSYTNGYPSAAWSVPDLDAIATFKFIDQTGSQVACVNAPLSNGITVQTPAVPIATGVITIVLILLGSIGSFLGAPSMTVHPGVSTGVASGPAAPHAPTATQAQVQAPSNGHGPPVGRMDPTVLFLHFQDISSSGLLSLRYPPIYQAFTVNFAWANFILPIHAFKKAARGMRKCNLNEDPAGHSTFTGAAVPPVGSGQTIGQTTGIDGYAQRLGINPQDIFAIAYMVFLCACAVLLGLFLFIGLAIQIGALKAKTPDEKQLWLARREKWQGISSNNSLRIMTLALSTLATFAFYQWTQRCTSGVTAFASATALVIVVLTLGGVCFFIWRIAQRPDGLMVLFKQDSIYGRRWGTLYNMLHEGSIYFVAPLLIVVLARSAITGFGQHHGLAQLCALIVLDLIVCVSLINWQPYYSRGYNRVNYMLNFTKAFSHILMIVFVESFHISQPTTTALGIVILSLNSLIGLILAGLTVLKLGWGTLWYKKRSF